MYQQVLEFHKHFDLPHPETPQLLEPELFKYRANFLREETYEFAVAHRQGDLVGAADALADLIYVAIGTALMMGLPLDEIFSAVHAANMTKQRATDVEQSKRRSVYDVIKPPGFVSPNGEIERLIREKQQWTPPV